MQNAHEVAPGLWVGAWPPPGNYSSHVDVIVFVAEDLPQPNPALYPNVRVRWFPFDDSSDPSGRDIDQALRAADAVARDLARGRRVLVTCRMGRNRSGFVAALALHIHTGAPGRETLRVVQKRRVDAVGVHAIANRAFQDYLMML